MNSNNNFVIDLANKLVSKGCKMTNVELAIQLNKAGLKTSYNDDYKGGRGTFNLIAATYHKLDKEGRSNERDNVAKAYTNYKGEHPYL